MVCAVSAATHARERAHSSWRVELVCVVGLLAAFVALLTPTLDRPLLDDRHDGFRQTQTAFTARIFHEEGIDLLHPQVPVLGEPFQIAFEFPLYQAAASLVMDLGVAEDTAMRATGLMCFVMTALLLYGLVRHVAGRIPALASLVAFVVTPLAAFWSRASTIDYLAAAGAVGFVWAFIVWRENRQFTVWVLCLVAGLVGMLVKPTTAVFWLIPALAYRPRGPWIALRRDAFTAALLVLPLAAGTAWTLHADAIKAATATTRGLTSSGLRAWNFGTLEQRLDPATWQEIISNGSLYLVGPVGLLLLVATSIVVWRDEQRRFWVGTACTALLPPLVLTNLYYVHDYYLVAVAPAVAALVGLGAAFVVEKIRRRRSSLVWAFAGVAAAALLAGWFDAGRPYWGAAFTGRGEREALFTNLADELAQVTGPTDLVAAYGLEWNPAVFYYARRKGLMVTSANESLTYDLIGNGPYAHLIALGEKRDFLARWPWIGALGQHTYALADNAGELSGAPFVVTERGRALDAHLSEAPRLRSPRTLDCSRPLRIRAGSQGTWLELRTRARKARVAVPTLAPLPARRMVFIGAELAEDGSFTIDCGGVDRLSIAGARDAGPMS
jgi:hypothetical protein